MRFARGKTIEINGEKVLLYYFFSVRNSNVIDNLADMPNIDTLRKCLNTYHKNEIWLAIDQK